MNNRPELDHAALLSNLADALRTDQLTLATELAGQLASAGALPGVELFSVAGRLEQAGQPQQAVALYREWLAHQDSGHVFAVQFNLATVLANSGDIEEAIAVFRTAANSAPDHEAGQAIRIQALGHIANLQTRRVITGDVLIILNVSDLDGAVAAAEELEDYRTLVFEPGVVDKAIERGLRNVEFVEWPNGPGYFELDRDANIEAYNIERALTEVTAELMPDVKLLSWQHLHLYYLIKASRWYAEMWPQMMGRLQHCRPHVFVNDNPSQFYWPNFIPALMLAENLMGSKTDFRAFVAGARHDHPGYVPMLVRIPGEEQPQPDILTHLPTCFYDAPYFNAELQTTGKRLFNIQSKYWDVPVEGAYTPPLVQIEHLQHVLPAELVARIESTTVALQQRLDELLLPLINTPDYRSRQARHMAHLLRAQIWMYFLLEQYFGTERPGKMLLSDHDTDFQGPLVSYAARHSIPVLILPHSKVSPDLFYSYRHATSLMHPMCGETILDSEQHRVPHFKLAYPFELRHNSAYPQPLRRVGLLLNALTANSGIYNTRYQTYMDGIRRIVAWCRSRGIELVVRCKPSFTMYSLLHEQTGLAPQSLHAWTMMPMADFAAACDVCVMYDAPTSGALEFLNASIPLLNAVPEDLSKVEARVCDPAVVPRASVPLTLRTLDSFVADEMNLFHFRSTQFQHYVRSYDGTHPLRAFL